MKSMPIWIATIAALAIAGAASSAPGEKGHGHDAGYAFGEPGNPKKPARDVVVTMAESDGKMLFSPDQLQVRKGEQVRFKLKNTGAIDHEIVLATLQENLAHAKEMEKNPGMEHDDPNAKRLAPSASGEIIWKFTKAGTFDFSCLIPGHREAGMHGTVIVK